MCEVNGDVVSVADKYLISIMIRYIIRTSTNFYKTGSLALWTVFTNCPGDLGSIPGRVIPKIFKIVLDTSLPNTQQYKVRIKGKVEQSWERSSTLSYTSV